MPLASAVRIPPPENWQEFEQLCRDVVVEKRGPTLDVNLHGRGGQAQLGVDFAVQSPDGVHGYQCKRVDSLSIAVIESVLRQADRFSPSLAAFTILTTARRDAELERQVLQISEDRRQRGTFTVAIVFWETIRDWLAAAPDVLRVHYPWLGVESPSHTDRVTEEVVLEQLRQAQALMDDGQAEQGAVAAEQVSQSAERLDSRDLRRRAHHRALRFLGEWYVVRHDLPTQTRKDIIRRMQAQVESLEALEEGPMALALERALIARLDERPDDAVKDADLVLSSAGADEHVARLDALIAKMQALWQLGRASEGLALGEEVVDIRAKVDAEAALALDATWIRTQSKSHQLAPEELRRFLSTTRSAEGVAPRRVLQILGEVAAEFGRQEQHASAKEVCLLAHDVAQSIGDSVAAAMSAMQAAEICTLIGDGEGAVAQLGRLESCLENARSNAGADPASHQAFVTLNAMSTFTRGRVRARLGFASSRDEADTASKHLGEAADALDECLRLAAASGDIRGDTQLFSADIHWWAGRVALARGRALEAAEHHRCVQSPAAMAHDRFREEVAYNAWTAEAESLVLAGQLERARDTVVRLLEDAGCPDSIRERARALREYLEQRLLPVVEWLVSPNGRRIGAESRRGTLRDAVSEQLSPLLSWWAEWLVDGPCPTSELLDFWGRGGLLRVAAAVRARPHAAIAVDAFTVNQIRHAVRVFCHLFDTIIVKWKGPIGAGLVFAPIHEAYGDGEDFGGHGYMVAAGDTFAEKPEWCPAIGWANPVPEEVSRFLASEANDFVKAGRLVLLPAPLAGCTQNATGWTDDLLTQRLLGGVVEAVCGTPEHSQKSPRPQRVIDLSSVALPFIDGLPLSELAKIVEETSSHAGALRKLLRASLLSDDLRWERWDTIASFEEDFAEASSELTARLTNLISQAPAEGWRVGMTTGDVCAASLENQGPALDSVTSTLCSIVGDEKRLEPWIPYWRLESCGGYLNWTAPLDNRSVAPPPEVLMMRPELDARETHTWLYEGDAGWSIPTVMRIPLPTGQD